MPFRLDPDIWPNRAKVQFTTAAWMANLVYEACKITQTVSNTVYIQHAVCEKLARDLGIPLAQLLVDLPTPRGPSAHLFDPAEATMSRGPVVSRVMIGPANTLEEVR